MLTPVRPTKGEPDYTRRMRDYKQGRQDQIENPSNWGFVNHLAQQVPVQNKSKAPNKYTKKSGAV